MEVELESPTRTFSESRRGKTPQQMFGVLVIAGTNAGVCLMMTGRKTAARPAPLDARHRLNT
ncbi:MAG TPA: hypothetical protein VGF45_11065 [Polyangia bacterium]